MALMPKFLKANGRVHHVRIRPGTASRAVVFANSLGTDFRIWDDVIDRLPEDVPILTYDKSGHGLSEAGTTTIEGFAADLAAIMEAQALTRALVCGVSVGGMIAQSLAAQRPDLVAGLVLCNTGYRIGSHDFWSDRIATVRDNGLDAMADGILERWFGAAFHAAHPDRLAGYRAMLSRTPLSGYLDVCAAIRDADLLERTGQLTCPTHCVAGSDDLSTPPDIINALASAIDGAGYTCLEGVGHLPCIEAPDQLASILRDQLEALP